MIASIAFFNPSQFQGRGPRILRGGRFSLLTVSHNYVIIRPDRASPKEPAECIFTEPMSLRVFVLFRIKGRDAFIRADVNGISRTSTFGSEPQWPPLMFAVTWEPELELHPWCPGLGAGIPGCDGRAVSPVEAVTHVSIRPLLKLTICCLLSSVSWPKWKMVCVTSVLIR